MRYLAIVACLILTGCGPYLTSYGNELAAGGPSAEPPLPEAGYTMASSSHSHGIQVSYWGEGGDYALWYPGNGRALLGTWRKGRGPEIYCFSYGVNTRNPVLGTRSQAGQERCGRISDDLWVAKVPGDVFNLQSGWLPAFDLTQCILPKPLVVLNDGACSPKD